MRKIISLFLMIFLCISMVSASYDYEEVGIDGLDPEESESDGNGNSNGGSLTIVDVDATEREKYIMNQYSENIRNRYEEMECKSENCSFQMNKEERNIDGEKTNVYVLEKIEEVKFLYMFKMKAKNEFVLSENGIILEQNKNFASLMYQFKLAN